MLRRLLPLLFLLTLALPVVAVAQGASSPPPPPTGYLTLRLKVGSSSAIGLANRATFQAAVTAAVAAHKALYVLQSTSVAPWYVEFDSVNTGINVTSDLTIFSNSRDQCFIHFGPDQTTFGYKAFNVGGNVNFGLRDITFQGPSVPCLNGGAGPFTYFVYGADNNPTIAGSWRLQNVTLTGLFHAGLFMPAGSQLFGEFLMELRSCDLQAYTTDGSLFSGGITGSDGAMTSAGTTLTSAGTTFTDAVIGQSVYVAAAGTTGAALIGTVLSRTDTHNVVLSVAAGATVSSKSWSIENLKCRFHAFDTVFRKTSIPAAANPAVTQATATANKTGNTVTSYTVNTAGSNYQSTTGLTVTVSGGSGSGATATANLTGTLASVQVLDGGTGYTSAPTIAFSGGGSDGTVAATAAVSGGAITSISVTNAGTFSGASAGPPIITLSGGGGSGALLVPVMSLTVASITAGNVGSGYTGSPTVTIAGGGASSGNGSSGDYNHQLYVHPNVATQIRGCRFLGTYSTASSQYALHWNSSGGKNLPAAYFRVEDTQFDTGVISTFYSNGVTPGGQGFQWVNNTFRGKNGPIGVGYSQFTGNHFYPQASGYSIGPVASGDSFVSVVGNTFGGGNPRILNGVTATSVIRITGNTFSAMDTNSGKMIQLSGSGKAFIESNWFHGGENAYGSVCVSVESSGYVLIGRNTFDGRLGLTSSAPITVTAAASSEVEINDNDFAGVTLSAGNCLNIISGFTGTVRSRTGNKFPASGVVPANNAAGTTFLNLRPGKGPDLASAATINPTFSFDTYHVTGTTGIDTVLLHNAAAAQAACGTGPLILIFDSTAATSAAGNLTPKTTSARVAGAITVWRYDQALTKWVEQ